MSMSPSNIIRIHPGFTWFLGTFDQNQFHRHYAHQLSIVVHKPIEVATHQASQIVEEAILIRSNTPHKITCEGWQLLILLNPTSSQGHFWSALAKDPMQKAAHPGIQEFRTTAQGLMAGGGDRKILIKRLDQAIATYDCFGNDYSHTGDARIENAIAYLHEQGPRIIPLEEIADHCHLSPSRFRHLFKERTGQTYRRAQLWNKVINAIPLFGKYPLTTIAHQCGFSDSAHFSRTFKENFGFSPRDLLKISPFVQV